MESKIKEFIKKILSIVGYNEEEQNQYITNFLDLVQKRFLLYLLESFDKEKNSNEKDSEKFKDLKNFINEQEFKDDELSKIVAIAKNTSKKNHKEEFKRSISNEKSLKAFIETKFTQDELITIFDAAFIEEFDCMIDDISTICDENKKIKIIKLLSKNYLATE